MSLDAIARFDELLVAGCKARAAEARAVRAECRAGNHRYLFRLQQADGKIFFILPGHGNIRERIE